MSLAQHLSKTTETTRQPKTETEATAAPAPDFGTDEWEAAFADFVHDDLACYDLDNHRTLALSVARDVLTSVTERVRVILAIRADEERTRKRIDEIQRRKAQNGGGTAPKRNGAKL